MQAQDRYKTILVIVTGLLVFSWLFDLPLLWKVALLVGLISVFLPAAAKAIEWAWLKLASGLGYVNSRFLLSLIFFGVLMPVAWFSRLFRKDSLKLKREHGASVFHTRNHKYRKEDLENIW